MLCILLASCKTQTARPTLYEQLGAQSGVEEIVDAFLVELANDKRIVHFFAKTNVPRFRRLLIEHFCELSDGPCTYTGDSMALAHRGMQIGDNHFNALVEDLVVAMEKTGTPVPAQNKLLALLAPMYSEIMEVQDIQPLP